MKLIQALIKLCVNIMITSLVCVVCTFTVMNAYIDMVLDQYQLKSTALTAPNWSQFMAHLGKQAEGYRLFREAKVAGGDTMQPKAITTTSETPQEDAVAVFGQQKAAGKTGKSTEPKSVEPKVSAGSSAVSAGAMDSGNSSSTNATNSESSNGTSNPSTSNGIIAPSGSVKVDSGTSTGSGSLSGAGGKVVVSGEEFTKQKEQLSNDDKNQIFKLLTRVPQAEIQHISLMMEDGITASELTDIKQLLQNYLKPEEYSQLLSMIKPQ